MITGGSTTLQAIWRDEGEEPVYDLSLLITKSEWHGAEEMPFLARTWTRCKGTVRKQLVRIGTVNAAVSEEQRKTTGEDTAVADTLDGEHQRPSPSTCKHQAEV